MSSTKSKLRLFGAFAALATLALAVSCKGFFPPRQIQSITLSPTTATVPLNGTFQMHAFGVDTSGQQLGDVTSKVTWSSSDAAVVNVGQNTGLLSGTALSTSAVTITASYQALTPQTATATVCVEGATGLTLKPPATSTVGGTTFPNGGGFQATVQSSGQTLDVTAGVTWTSSNTSVLTITGGEDPAAVTTQAVTTDTPVTVTATYTCNTTQLTQSEIITVTHQ